MALVPVEGGSRHPAGAKLLPETVDPVDHPAAWGRMHKDPEDKPFRPPFWSSAIHGVPMRGDTKEQLKPRKPHPPKGGSKAGSNQVLSRGSFRTARSAHIPVSRIETIEDELRDSIREKMRVEKIYHETEKSLLTRAFWSVDEDSSGRITWVEFQTAMEFFGLELTIAECRAMFEKYGQDKRECMPYDVFVNALFTSKNRQLVWRDLKKGAFQMGAPKHKLAFDGMIKYPQCKKGVFAPSDWGAEMAVRSQQEPGGMLDLEFVYGYAGISNTDNNLFYTANMEVVYYVAAVGVVYDRVTHTQRFFCGHSDDITSLALDPSRNYLASGQCKNSGEPAPYVCVWDATSLECLAKLVHGPTIYKLSGLGFSPDGAQLTSCGCDLAHTVFVWDWRANKIVGSGKGKNGIPPQVYGITWNPDPRPHECTFVTFGVVHVKFWSKNVAPDGSELWDGKIGTFGTADIVDQTGAEFMPNGDVLCGTPKGDIYVWRVTQSKVDAETDEASPLFGQIWIDEVLCVKTIKAHSRDLMCLKLRSPPPSWTPESNEPRILLSGGGDGKVHRWEVVAKRGEGPEPPDISFSKISTLKLPPAFKREPPSGIRGLDAYPGTKVFVIGTTKNSVWEIDMPDEGEEQVKSLIRGHREDLYGCHYHPTDPNIFITASLDDRVYLWHAGDREMVASVNVGEPNKSAAFNHDGSYVAVGCESGAVAIVLLSPEFKSPEIDPTLTVVSMVKDCISAVDCLAFSPDGNSLAVGSHDCMIDVYTINHEFDPCRPVKPYMRRRARCEGHSSTIKSVQWSVDSSKLLTTCQGYEILWWEAKNGRQVLKSQKNQDWHMWTSPLGFPVMGIWSEGFGNSDINYVMRSHSGDHLICTTNDSAIQLYNFPCVIENAPHKRYTGHASFVMCGVFMCDDSRVVSVGGGDRAVFQWKTHGIKHTLKGAANAVRAAHELESPDTPGFKAEGGNGGGKADGDGTSKGEASGGLKALEGRIAEQTQKLAAKDEQIDKLMALLKKNGIKAE